MPIGKVFIFMNTVKFSINQIIIIIILTIIGEYLPFGFRFKVCLKKITILIANKLLDQIQRTCAFTVPQTVCVTE